MADLGRIVATRKSGQEPITYRGAPIGPKLADFWGWSRSDLVENIARGIRPDPLSGLEEPSKIRPTRWHHSRVRTSGMKPADEVFGTHKHRTRTVTGPISGRHSTSTSNWRSRTAL